MGQEQSVQQTFFNLKVVSAAEGKLLLDEAETIDNYRAFIENSEIEKKARHNHNYFPLADSQYNKDDVQKWLTDFVGELGASHDFSWIVRFLSKYDATVYIVNLQFSADGGMPHTRPLKGDNRGLICFPGGLRGTDWEKTTLIHELIHIVQRLNQPIWNKIYEKNWQMRPYNGKIPNKYELAVRYNPDTIMAGVLYIYKNKWVPIIIYTDITRPDIHQTMLVYYNSHTGVVWDELPDELGNDIIFGDRRIISPMREHPNELLAWLFSNPNKYKDFPFYPNIN